MLEEDSRGINRLKLVCTIYRTANLYWNNLD